MEVDISLLESLWRMGLEGFNIGFSDTEELVGVDCDDEFGGLLAEKEFSGFVCQSQSDD